MIRRAAENFYTAVLEGGSEDRNLPRSYSEWVSMLWTFGGMVVMAEELAGRTTVT